MNTLACPHCGEIDWSRAPRLRGIVEYLGLQGEVTARDVADHFGISIANASNQMMKVALLGLGKRVRTEPAEGGGVEHFYRPVPGIHSGTRRTTDVPNDNTRRPRAVRRATSETLREPKL